MMGLDGGIAVSKIDNVTFLLTAIYGEKLIFSIFDFMLLVNFVTLSINSNVSYLLMKSQIVSVLKQLMNLKCHLYIKWPFQCQLYLLFLA